MITNGFRWVSTTRAFPGCYYEVLGGLIVATQWQLSSPRGLESCNPGRRIPTYSFEAASFEAFSFEAASFEALCFESASFEACSFEAASFEAFSFEAASFDAFSPGPGSTPMSGHEISRPSRTFSGSHP